MSERPFMQLYVSDFVGDTRRLSAEHVGAYMRILFALWQADCALPCVDVDLAKIAGLPISRWRRIWPDFGRFFEIADSHIVASVHVKKWASKTRVFGRQNLSASIRSEIYERDRGLCRYCGTADGPFHVDHVVPVIKGGSDDVSNLALACQGCNLSKGSKTLEEWRQ